MEVEALKLSATVVFERLRLGFADVDARPWLVLGGGGLKGMAHVGAWRALEEAGIRPQGIVGTSIGGLVGALIASGTSVERMHELARELERSDIARVNRRAVWINGIRQLSLFQGEVLREYFDRILPDGGWQTMSLPLLINAVDLADGSTEWFGTGARTDVPLAEAVYASSALPVFYPPSSIAGRAFVDGGTAHPLPLLRASSEGAGRIIGVDVGSGEKGHTADILERGMIAVHERIFSIMTWRRRQELLTSWQGPPVLYVRPRLDGFPMFDFESVEYFLEEGYRATKEALRSLPSGGS